MFYRAPLSRLQPRHRIGVVEGESLAVFDDLPAVYKDVAHRALGRRIDEAADRVVERPHRRMLGIDDHEIRLGAGREPAEIVATERVGTADGRGGEDVGRGHGMGAFGSDSGEDSRCAHLLDQIVREGVSADAEIDPGCVIRAEMRDAAAREHGRAMGDICPGRGKAGEVVAGRPVQPGVIREKSRGR